MKWLLCFLWIGMSITAWTQTNPPIWIHDVYRKINFPPEKWHTGFVQDRLKADDDAGAVLKTMERNAINRLAESIIVTIESETQVENNNRQQSENDNYRQKVKTVASATLVNLDVNSYYDPSTGMLYAFAAVKRSDLADFYLKQIALHLNNVETSIEATKKHIIAGEKSSARRKIKEAQRLLDEVRIYRTMINVVNEDENVKDEREEELSRTIEHILLDFNTEVIIFVNCRLELFGNRNDAFKNDPGILCEIIKQALHEHKCIITDDINQADFELTLITSTTQRSDGTDPFGIISYYANVKGSLYDRSEQRNIVEFIIMNDSNVYAAGNSPEDAAIKAFKRPALSDRILEKLLLEIND